MYTVTIVKIFDYSIIGVIGAFVLFCLIGAVYTTPWREVTRHKKAQREFNLFWRSRLLLQLVGTLWLLAQLLRLQTLVGNVILPDSNSQSTREVICRVYLMAALGFLEPFFLLLALVLCKTSRRHTEDPAVQARRNGWPVALALICSLPVLAAQSVAAWLSTAFKDKDWEQDRNAVGHYFFGTYVEGSATECRQDTGGCIECIFPAASSIISLAFLVLYLIWLHRITHEISSTIINRKLRRRLRMFQALMYLFLLVSVAFTGVSIVTTPFHILFQIMWAGYVLCIAAVITLTSFILVIQPVHDAQRADRALGKLADGGWDSAVVPPVRATPTREMMLLSKKTVPIDRSNSNSPTNQEPKLAVGHPDVRLDVKDEPPSTPRLLGP